MEDIVEAIFGKCSLLSPVSSYHSCLPLNVSGLSLSTLPRVVTMSCHSILIFVIALIITWYYVISLYNICLPTAEPKLLESWDFVLLNAMSLPPHEGRAHGRCQRLTELLNEASGEGLHSAGRKLF